MAEIITKLRIFVASPGDVWQERKKMEEIINELNHGIADEKKVILELVKWETHGWPGFGRDAQDVINGQIGAYDIFVGIMWNRLGSPTNTAQSGTVEEFERAYQLWKAYKQPKLFFYFNKSPYSFETLDAIDQKRKVIEFKSLLQKLGALYWEYESLEGFQKDISRHLTSEIRKWDNKITESPSKHLSEQFCDLNQWDNLLKLGSWRIDSRESMSQYYISGKGVYSFLLSKNIYGISPFTIRTSIKFFDYRQFENEGPDTANAGIIFGWQDEVENNKYYHLLFTGEHLSLEEIGFDGGDDYYDFRRLARNTPFKIQDGEMYRILISFTHKTINVFIDDKIIYSVTTPRSLNGRVGIRPWRAKVECEYFEITSKTPFLNSSKNET